MQIQTALLIDKQRRLAGAKGPAQVELLEDLQPGVQIADLEAYQYDWLGRVQRRQAFVNIAAVAAQFSQVVIFNPSKSGTLLLIDRSTFNTGAAGGMTVGLVVAAGPYGTVIAQNALSADLRWCTGLPVNATTPGVGLVFAGTNAADVSAITPVFPGIAFPAAFQSVDEEWGVVLIPGTGITFVLSTVNQALRGGVWWRERPFDPAEMAGAQQL